MTVAGTWIQKWSLAATKVYCLYVPWVTAESTQTIMDPVVVQPIDITMTTGCNPHIRYSHSLGSWISTKTQAVTDQNIAVGSIAGWEVTLVRVASRPQTSIHSWVLQKCLLWQHMTRFTFLFLFHISNIYLLFILTPDLYLPCDARQAYECFRNPERWGPWLSGGFFHLAGIQGCGKWVFGFFSLTLFSSVSVTKLIFDVIFRTLLAYFVLKQGTSYIHFCNNQLSESSFHCYQYLLLCSKKDLVAPYINPIYWLFTSVII